MIFLKSKKKMEKTIFEHLEKTAEEFQNKIAFVDSYRKISYKNFVEECKIIATNLLSLRAFNKPMAVYLDKTIDCLECMIGVNYSGNYYTIVDTKMPVDRVESILNTLEPVCIITNSKNLKKIEKFNDNFYIVLIDNFEKKIDEISLNLIKSSIIDTNPMYILFTSGSTGTPKGTVLSHRAVTTYVKWFKETFDINEKTIFGSQTPFYFSMSVSDVFSTMLSGATFYIIPKMLFSFPIKLVEFLNINKINTIYWVPSALCIVANFKTLDYDIPRYLKKILFAGEVMPMKQLNIWRSKIPGAMYANLFGPTETTDICSYYIVDRNFKNSETLPIGKHCDNCDLLIIKEDNSIAQIGEEGELCARGSFLASGYYKNPKKTNEVFIQNPLNKLYPEIIYRTGDVVKLNENNEILYVSRSDFQIKHMGYRIELGEIESAVNAIEMIEICVCIYDTKNANIVLFYKSNELDEMQVLEGAKKKLPQYMWPNRILKLDKIPYNSNGKIDRKFLKDNYCI